MKTKQVLIGLVGLAAAVVAMETQAATLKIGDPAPKLQAGKWVQGEPVTQFEPGTAYILSFWATRSAPCLLSTPHLNEVWTKFKDKGLVVIGQHVWEQDESQVPAFIKKLGDKMTYRVALDNRQGSERGKMAEAWIEAAGVRGVPVVFVVDKQGRVAWIGRPLLLKDSVIEEVLAGKWDLAKAAADCEKAMRDEAQVARLSQQLQQAMQDKQWAKAETTLAEIARLVPQDQREGVESLGVTILLRKGDPAAAAKLADTLSLRHQDSAVIQNELAWRLALHDALKGAALDTAIKIATRANTAACETNPAVLDTMARLVFMQGDKAKAIAWEEKAIAIADADLKPKLRKTLDTYKQGQLPVVTE